MAKKKQADIQTDSELAVDVRPPSHYRVILLNDDFTTMEFVIHVLKKYFHKTQEESYKIMMEVHSKGAGLCGIFPLDIARTKSSSVIEEARANSYPLQCIIKKDDHD